VLLVAQKRYRNDYLFRRARVDVQIKNEAAAVLTAMGLAVSDAFRLMMVKVAKETALPFEPLVPNDETIEAMKAARCGELTTAGVPRKLPRA
jgi:DNA-damage-inducible protein J